MNAVDKSKEREYHWKKDVCLCMATNLSTEVAWPNLVPKASTLLHSCLLSPLFVPLLGFTVVTPVSIRQNWTPVAICEAFGLQKNVDNSLSPDRL